MTRRSWLNALDAANAASELRKCCGSSRWVERMIAARPFESDDALFARADEIWSQLGEEDWREAFAAHPRIGSRRDVDRKAGEERTWSEKEQSGAAQASDDTKQALAEANEAYERKFGHIYIVCATGKTGDEMLALCRARLANDAATELRVAAEEQRKITRIRLEKLLKEAP